MQFNTDCVLLSSRVLEELHPDDIALVQALKKLGIQAEILNWQELDESDCLPTRASYIFRTTWGYDLELPRFQKFLKKMQKSQLLTWNPTSLVRWNLNKTYLFDLERNGVDIVPSISVRDEKEIDFNRIQRRLLSKMWVVKPAIGASARGQFLMTSDRTEENIQKLRQAIQTGPAIVQSFIPRIETEGEFSLVYIDGQLTHCIRKIPADNDFRVQEEHGGRYLRVPATKEMKQIAEKALSALPEEWIYARVDLVMDEDELFRLIELELIEPQLFFDLEPKAADRFAESLNKVL